MFNIKVNGKSEDIGKEMSALELLKSKDIKKETVVFMLNDKIIKRDELDKYKIKQNDEIEILRFVAGG